MNAMTRLGGAIGVALTLALVLVGCGGIPTTGPVIAGPAVDEVDPEYVVSPNGPTAGADPNDILTGFLQAVRSPVLNYQIARQFLTPQLAQSWDPNAGVLIRTGSAHLVAGGPRVRADDRVHVHDLGVRRREGPLPGDRRRRPFRRLRLLQGRWSVADQRLRQTA